MKMPNAIEQELIAVCGLNCLACSAYLNNKTPCPGCSAPNEKHKRKSCVNCSKKKCAHEMGLQWCFECDSFPCSKIKSINKRYTTKYNINLIENGQKAKESMNAFLTEQKEKLACNICGGVINQHKKECSECGTQFSNIV
jgi:hypothetical protein